MTPVLLSEGENNPVYNIVNGFKLIFLNENINPGKQTEYELGLVSLFNSIFSSPLGGHVFFYIVKEQAFSTTALIRDLRISEASAYRMIKRFQTLGLIVRVTKVTRRPRESRGGPRATIWALSECEPQVIQEAIKKHSRLISPKFRMAEEIAQSLIEEYLEPRNQEEITYRELLILVKARPKGWGGYRGPDIAELTADSLTHKGVKVWR